MYTVPKGPLDREDMHRLEVNHPVIEEVKPLAGMKEARNPVDSTVAFLVKTEASNTVMVGGKYWCRAENEDLGDDVWDTIVNWAERCFGKDNLVVFMQEEKPDFAEDIPNSVLDVEDLEEFNEDGDRSVKLKPRFMTPEKKTLGVLAIQPDKPSVHWYHMYFCPEKNSWLSVESATTTYPDDAPNLDLDILKKKVEESHPGKEVVLPFEKNME